MTNSNAPRATGSTPPASSPPKRREVKFAFPRAYASLALEWLRHACLQDPRFAENGIHSLYFDTATLDALDEKENSDYLKRKVRIRWYTDPSGEHPGDTAHLEVKAKEGARSWKHRLALPCAARDLHRDPLGTARRLTLADYEGAVSCPLHDLHPVCVISYVRRRFIEMSSSARVALDTDIGPSHLNMDLLAAMAGSVPDVSILEVKGPDAGDLPPPLLPLRRFGLHRASFSKYAECLKE